jgi:hypothetical protein
MREGLSVVGGDQLDVAERSLLTEQPNGVGLGL